MSCIKEEILKKKEEILKVKFFSKFCLFYVDFIHGIVFDLKLQMKTMSYFSSCFSLNPLPHEPNEKQEQKKQKTVTQKNVTHVKTTET